MTKNVFMERERERELKQHQDRIQNMKPCVDSNLVTVRESPFPETKPPVRVRIDRGKLRQIEQQNYQLLMRLRYIHKNYSLYMPKKSVYLQRGEAGRVKKAAKKPKKDEDQSANSEATRVSPDNQFVNEEMANRVAGMKLWQK